jgi:probable LLM family oxidoreductase
MPNLELGLDTFGDLTQAATGGLTSHAQTLRDVLEQAVLADQAGLAFFGAGEHHRPDFAISAPEVLLGAIAGRTRSLRLGSAVTVLGSDDPVRVFERFSTLDAVSNGRAEVILGRGSFTESFPLFGFVLRRYQELFEERLELFAALRLQSPVTWSGQTRAPLQEQRVFPPVERGLLTTWVGVGGTPESVVRTARHGFRLMLAIIGGEASRFAPLVELYHRALAQLKQEPNVVGVHSPGHVAATDDQAREELWPHWSALVARIGRERGWSPPSKAHFERECAEGAVYCGSPETVARRIAATARALRLSRFDLKYASGAMPHGQLMKSIELYATQVAPRVRELLADEAVSLRDAPPEPHADEDPSAMAERLRLQGAAFAGGS